MNDQNRNQPTLYHRLQELDELYYTAPLALYEATLQLVIAQLEHILPGFTIAFAEIYAAAGERQQHGGMCHVIMPTERNAQ